MQTRRHYSLPSVLFWTRQQIVLATGFALAVVLTYELTGWSWMRLPPVLLSLVGIAVAFFAGFKNNSSYGRLWEARKIWGAIVNASRSWGIGARDLVFAVGDPEETEALRAVHAELVHRHIAWLTALRHMLRGPRTWEHPGGPDEQAVRSTIREHQVDLRIELEGLIGADEIERVTGRQNAAAQLLAEQSRRIAELRRSGHLDAFRHIHLQELLVELYTQQGKAERIKNFPFPRQYASFTLYAIWIFIAMLPFGLLSAFDRTGAHTHWAVIPASALVSWVFHTTEKIGDYSENPFEGLWNDIPITALSRTIEIDMREMLDEDRLPPPMEPVNDILS
ncbi:MAG: bestrophin family protein [Sandaracinaceae bacterium]